MNNHIDHVCSMVSRGKVIHWTYKGPIRMNPPQLRAYWVPYHYPRGSTRNDRSTETRDDHMFARRKRKIINWMKPDRVRNRVNWFKHNVEIRERFKDCSYRNRWY